MSETADNILHIGLSQREAATSPSARFFNPVMEHLPVHVVEALTTGALAHELLPPVEHAGELQATGYWPVETGYTIGPDGSARVFVLSPMPGVTPAMWDWWFVWHGSSGERYKLWHPQAHIDVRWQDGRDDLDYYIGRVSNVVEYVGSVRMNVAIRFVSPATLGFDEQQLASNGEVAICARVGLSGAPIETGWLVHHVRPVPGGCEMRTRIWLGGSNVRPRGMPGAIGAWLGRTASRLQPITVTQVEQLMVHDAHEMGHLAAILPQLYETFKT